MDEQLLEELLKLASIKKLPSNNLLVQDIVGWKLNLPAHLSQDVPEHAQNTRADKWGDKQHITLIKPKELRNLRKKGVFDGELHDVFGHLPEKGLQIQPGPFTIDAKKKQRLYHALEVQWPEAQKARQSFGLKPTPLHVTVGMQAKEAELKTKLQPHQERVVQKIQKPDQPGLVVVHGLGSGKTLTSIAAQDALGMKSQVVAPAALLGNYKKEREKHLTGKTPPAELVSMQNLARKKESPKSPLMIVDEAHRARDPASSTFQALRGNTAEKRLLLTGSPFYNHPSDISPLINLAAGDKLLPYDKEEFTKRYIQEKQVSPGLWDRLVHGATGGTQPMLNEQAAKELRQHFGKWIDYHPGSSENFPTVEHRDVPVPMTEKQLEVYDTLMDKAPPWVSAKVKRGLPPNKQESQQLNAFLTAARQVANSTRPFVPQSSPEEPKIQAAFQNLQKTLQENPRAKAVVYSNYLQAGITPYKERLQAAGIPFGEFTGEMNTKTREQLVRDYNENKIRTLLLSSAGGEGLDLKGTRLLQVLDPHWNDEKLKQVEGRGARYMSHADLPPEERKLLVERYLATRPQGAVSGFFNKMVGREPDKSVDQYLSQMSGDKEKLIEQFRGLLPQEKKQG